MKAAKTTGLEWLYHSMAAFNGSGYADKASGETFLQSYTLYNKMRHRDIALEIIETFPNEAMEFAEHLAKAKDPGRTPTSKFYKRYIARLQTNADQLEIL